MILSDLTRDIGTKELEKDGNEHQDWAREGCGLFFPVLSAGDIVAVLRSSYFILLSVADACSSNIFSSFYPLVI